MPEIVISSLQGGLSTKSPTSLLDNQCGYAQNVEWYKSKCGERRLGTDAIDLTGSPVENCDRIVWSFRHLPTGDYKDAQFWFVGINDGTPDTAVWCYKDTTWHTVVPVDELNLVDSDDGYEYQISGASLHGKLFIAYASVTDEVFSDIPKDRLHVWDGTTLRRTGLDTPDQPTAADTGGAGSMQTARFYRTRLTLQEGGVTVLRSE